MDFLEGFSFSSLTTTTTFFLIVAILIGWKLLSGWIKVSNLPPAVPGVPLIGNLHQLKSKKPYQTFAKWAETFGPIYSIKLGSTPMVVINSTEVAKEALVTKFSSISTRKVTKAQSFVTCQKSVLAMCDYGEYHKMIKQYMLRNLLGTNGQKQNHCHRDTMIQNIISSLYSEIANNPQDAVKLKDSVETELFGLALKEVVGQDVKSIYVEELGVTISKQEMYNVLVHDVMMAIIEFDWRDYFPYMRWVPNRSLEMKIQKMDTRKIAVTKALITEQKKRISHGEEVHSFLDFLVSVEHTLTELQFTALIWEPIIESSDTTLVTIEWAMYELAKSKKCQDRLYQEIQKVCGSEKIAEEHLERLPYLNAVFHETLRVHAPLPILPPRYVHEDTQLGGYTIPAGTQIAINVYACNMNKKDWDVPEEWKPERFLTGKYNQGDMYKTMTFGGGKRVCAGSLQASLIACTAIGRLVQEFEWELKDGEEESVETIKITTHKLHPMQAYITPRKSYV